MGDFGQFLEDVHYFHAFQCLRRRFECLAACYASPLGGRDTALIGERSRYTGATTAGFSVNLATVPCRTVSGSIQLYRERFGVERGIELRH